MLTTTLPTLIGLPYSPWSEKARWALGAAGVPFRKQHYQPMIGEPGLRRITGNWRGPVSVPVLVTADRAIADSAAIARWADAQGPRPGTLFPAGAETAIDHWIDVGERALAAGRTLALLRQLHDKQALLELVPPPLRRTLGPFAVQLAAFGVRRTLRKYKATDVQAAEQALDAALETLRAGLVQDGHRRPTLLPTFTFADIAACQALGFVQPVDSPHVKMGPGTRTAFSDPARAEKYADLVAWRDALYAAHRDA